MFPSSTVQPITQRLVQVHATVVKIAGVNAPLDLFFGPAVKRNESDMWYFPPICQKKIDSCLQR